MVRLKVHRDTLYMYERGLAGSSGHLESSVKASCDEDRRAVADYFYKIFWIVPTVADAMIL